MQPKLPAEACVEASTASRDCGTAERDSGGERDRETRDSSNPLRGKGTSGAHASSRAGRIHYGHGAAKNSHQSDSSECLDRHYQDTLSRHYQDTLSRHTSRHTIKEHYQDTIRTHYDDTIILNL